jgi:hypothetical protein
MSSHNLFVFLSFILIFNEILLNLIFRNYSNLINFYFKSLINLTLVVSDKYFYNFQLFITKNGSNKNNTNSHYNKLYQVLNFLEFINV